MENIRVILCAGYYHKIARVMETKDMDQMDKRDEVYRLIKSCEESINIIVAAEPDPVAPVSPALSAKPAFVVTMTEDHLIKELSSLKPTMLHNNKREFVSITTNDAALKYLQELKEELILQHDSCRTGTGQRNYWEKIAACDLAMESIKIRHYWKDEEDLK